MGRVHKKLLSKLKKNPEWSYMGVDKNKDNYRATIASRVRYHRKYINPKAKGLKSLKSFP